MPEGPEVRKVAMGLQKALPFTVKDVWVSEEKFRKTLSLKPLMVLKSHCIDNVDSYGKVLFFYSGKKPIMLARLGMTGCIYIQKANEERLAHTHLVFQAEGKNQQLRFVDPRRFGLMSLCDESYKEKILRGLGPDPFSLTENDKVKIFASIKKSSREIKEILLDQKVISGVGNIYASECLFLSGIHPQTKGVALTLKAFNMLISNICEVLKSSFEHGGTSFSDFVDPFGVKGKNIFFLKVFKREGKPCFICKNPIVRLIQNNRSTFLCSFCQKMP